MYKLGNKNKGVIDNSTAVGHNFRVFVHMNASSSNETTLNNPVIGKIKEDVHEKLNSLLVLLKVKHTNGLLLQSLL
jgi:hypothetical protein